MDAPLDPPPFPNGQWQLSCVAAPISVPVSYGQYPLQKSLACIPVLKTPSKPTIRSSPWSTLSSTTEARTVGKLIRSVTMMLLPLTVIASVAYSLALRETEPGSQS
jgi:hypothetical protein